MLLILLITYQAPTINWVSVMENLDHEGFNVPDEASFSLLMSIYRKACQVCSFIKYSTFEKTVTSEILLKDGIELFRIHFLFVLFVGLSGGMRKGSYLF